MSSIAMPDERTIYSSHRQDDTDALAFPVFSEHALGMLRSAGVVLHPEPGELLWDAGDPYDLNLVLTGRNAVIVGGANSAGQAALFLARHAGQVHVLIRRDGLRDMMSNYLAQRLTHHERVTVHSRSELCAVHGASRLSALTWRDRALDRDVRLDAAALFLMIGADPCTTWSSRPSILTSPALRPERPPRCG
jgi:Pyridine nucleotide-disulphide oxidoreductase